MSYQAPLFVEVRFINKETGEIKEQQVFMGDFPLMTDRGTFVINGTERVVVSQLVRSPGVYYSEELDKTTDKSIFATKVIPARGAWLELETDRRDIVSVRVDRKRKQPVTVLLKALGIAEGRDEILDLFGGAECVEKTLEKDFTETREEALIEIYKRLRPGEPPTVESARSLLEGLFFNPQRYDLAKVGRPAEVEWLGANLDPGRAKRRKRLVQDDATSHSLDRRAGHQLLPDRLDLNRWVLHLLGRVRPAGRRSSSLLLLDRFSRKHGDGPGPGIQGGYARAHQSGRLQFKPHRGRILLRQHRRHRPLRCVRRSQRS